MTTNPLVSIIIPVYNVEPYLTQCIESVVNQTYRNIEVICVNDGSTDNSLSLLQNYADKDERLRIFNLTNKGVSAARNDGLSEAKGEFIMFVDADDWLDTNCIETIIENCGLEFGSILMFPYYSEYADKSLERKLFPQDITFYREDKNKLARRMIGPRGDEIVDPTRLDSYGTVWGKLYHKSVIKGLAFVDLNTIGTAEDSLFNIQAFKQATTVYYTNSVHYHYRKTNATSVTHGYKPNLISMWLNQYKMIGDMCHSDNEKTALQNRIALNVFGASSNEYISDKPRKNISALLKNEVYSSALSQLNISYMPAHWRTFFWCAKHRFTHGLMFLLYCIKLIR